MPLDVPEVKAVEVSPAKKTAGKKVEAMSLKDSQDARVKELVEQDVAVVTLRGATVEELVEVPSKGSPVKVPMDEIRPSPVKFVGCGQVCLTCNSRICMWVNCTSVHTEHVCQECIHREARRDIETGRLERQKPEPHTPLDEELLQLLPVFEDYDTGAASAAFFMRNGGLFSSLMQGEQIISSSRTLIDKCPDEGFVGLCAFTYDHPLIQASLIGALRRGCKVTMFIDKQEATKGVTKRCLERLLELQDHGAEVLLCKGALKDPRLIERSPETKEGNSGRCHMKCLLMGIYFTVGSCNWTVAAMSNSEINAFLRLEPEGLRVVLRIMYKLRSFGELLDRKVHICQGRLQDAVQNVPLQDD